MTTPLYYALDFSAGLFTALAVHHVTRRAPVVLYVIALVLLATAIILQVTA